MDRGRLGSSPFKRMMVVGVASNAMLYLLYILATTLGAGHKTSMTVLYALGVVQTFVANRSWSFRHKGPARMAFLRYLVAYLLAYLLNLSVMHVLVDELGYSDRAVQACMVIIVAVVMYLLQKYWVFRVNRDPSEMEAV